MTSWDNGSATWNYTYRADGMRTSKVKNSGGAMDTAYAYDGQMPIEEHNTGTVWPVHFVELVQYGLGARGIDHIIKYTDRDTIEGFPIYDGHGNMIATIGRNGSSYSLGDQRVYDVWGQIRSGSTATQPKMRYCANLGHPTDDENGLIYMRARYYEPWTGRFVSQDEELRGPNWFTYAKNNPVGTVDVTGNEGSPDTILHMILEWLKLANVPIPKEIQAVDLILSATLKIYLYSEAGDMAFALASILFKAGGAIATSSAALYAPGFAIMAGVCGLAGMLLKLTCLVQLAELSMNLWLLSDRFPEDPLVDWPG